VSTNAHLCGTYTKAPSSTSGTALGTACSSQALQTVALMAFRDRLTAGQAAVSTWNMASNNLVSDEAGVCSVAGGLVVPYPRVERVPVRPVQQAFGCGGDGEKPA
jgi:hypothetical protein